MQYNWQHFAQQNLIPLDASERRNMYTFHSRFGLKWKNPIELAIHK